MRDVKMHGWCGKVLGVDLDRNQIEIINLNVDDAKLFIGGRGLNIRRLFDMKTPRINPFASSNLLCLAPGLFSGTPLGMSSRLHVTTLSSLTGIVGDGSVGGAFAHRLKKAGFDQVVIRGHASKPHYLVIDDGDVSLCDASDLWEKDVWEMTDWLKERHGEDISVAGIGIAGERLVRVASTMVDKYASAARGSGAVWGSKRLKAIVVRGRSNVGLHDRNAFLKLAGDDGRFLAKDGVQREVASVYGSHYGITHWYPGFQNSEKALEAHDIPESLTPEAWKLYETGRVGCQNCTVKCKNVYEIPSGKRKGEKGEGLEYECVYCLGTNCGIDDPVALMEMENLSDMHGMDVVALGNAVAFAKDLFNRGIIDKRDTGGLDLSWQNAEDQVELVRRTAMGEGFGRMVGEGMFSMAKKIGKNAMDYCYHVKGLSRGLHPAGLFSLSHAVATRGADHLRGRSWAAGDNSDEAVLGMLVEKGIVSSNPVTSLLVAEYATTLADCFGRCKGAVNTWTAAVPLIWKYPIFQGLAQLASTATGEEFTEEDLQQVGKRVNALERAFNALCGITSRDDSIPQNPWFAATVEGEKEREMHWNLVKQYYHEGGYGEDGMPHRHLLESLDLGFAADKLDLHAQQLQDQKEKSVHPQKHQWDGPILS